MSKTELIRDNGREGLAGGPEGDRPMSFWDHLNELRMRLFRCVIATLIGLAICWAFTAELIEFLRIPLEDAWRSANLTGAPHLQVLKIEDPLVVDIRVALTSAIFLAGPVIFYQIWMFVAPGLYKHERRFAIPFVWISVSMFLLGAAFAYQFVIPYIYRWLLEYGGGTYSVQLELANYIKGTTMVLLTFGGVFEFPLLIAFLAKMGIVSHRSLMRYWRVSVLAIFIVAGFLTPPEPVSQLMMAGPMVLLFFIGVGVAYLLNPEGRNPEPSSVEDDEVAAADVAVSEPKTASQDPSS
jgi:sec-independent protein translocase protein TatC